MILVVVVGVVVAVVAVRLKLWKEEELVGAEAGAGGAKGKTWPA